MRPLTERDLIAAYRMITPAAVDIINSGHEAMPQLLFLEMSKARTGTIEKVRVFHPATVREAHENAEKKEMLMAVITKVLREPQAWARVHPPDAPKDRFTPHIAVHISEAWTVTQSSPVVDVMPRDHPERSEVLLITVHLREHSYMHVLRITTDAHGRHCEMTEWKPHDPNGPQLIRGIFKIQPDEL